MDNELSELREALRKAEYNLADYKLACESGCPYSCYGIPSSEEEVAIAKKKLREYYEKNRL